MLLGQVLSNNTIKTMSLYTLPKFIWKHIIDNLTIHDIVNMHLVLKHFGNMIDEANWKRCFLYNRLCSIALVQCESQQINDFWRYACYNHVKCDSVDNMFDILEIDNKCKVYNKIFIKTGIYEIDTDINARYIHCNHSIDIIGSGLCTIITENYSNKFNEYFISFTGYFSAYNIIFRDTRFIMRKFDKLILDNCIFDNSSLSLYRVSNAVVTNCTFNSVFPITISGKSNLTLVKYTISNNIFKNKFNKGVFISCYGEYNNASIINITNNTISCRNILCRIEGDVTILFDNNHISTVKSCILCKQSGCNSAIMFKNNIFDHVEKLYYNDNKIAGLDTSNNTYIECGPELAELN